MIQEYEGHFISTLIAAMQEIEIPTPPSYLSDSAKRIQQAYYLKEHYFDQFNLSDTRLLRSGAYHNKLIHYMEKLTVQEPDSLWESAHYLVEASRGSEETFQYTLATLANKYAKSKIMGQDYVFARLAEVYYLTGLADWISEETKKKMHCDTFAIE